MMSNEEGGMVALLERESIGSNAGSYKGFLCAGANFVLDRKTGLISEFTNRIGDALKHSGFTAGTFRIAII